MFRTYLPAGAAASCLLLAMPVAAQVRDQDAPPRSDIIVTGTKTGDFGAKSGIPIERVPQSIQVLDEDELIERGVRSVGDVLRAVPSANVGGSRVSRYQSFSLKIRGFSLTRCATASGNAITRIPTPRRCRTSPASRC